MILIINDTSNKTLLEKIKSQNATQLAIIIISVISIVDFFVFAIITTNSKGNERIYSRIKNNSLIDMAGFLGFYILSTLTIDNDYLWIIINVIGYIVVGIFITKSEKIYMCPAYLFLGYCLYETDDNHKVLVRLSREKYNIMLADSYNGIEAKRISVNSHLVQIKK